MNNLSLIINAILALLVGVLFYFHFKGTPAKITANTSTVASSASSKIAYVDMDTLEKYFLYFKNRKEEIEKRQKAIESAAMGDEERFRTEYQQAAQKAQTLTSKEEYDALEQRMQQKQAELQKKKENSQKSIEILSAETMKMSEEINGKLDSVITEYNKDKFDYVFSYRKIGLILYKNKAQDISKDIIELMNERYNKK